MGNQSSSISGANVMEATKNGDVELLEEFYQRILAGQAASEKWVLSELLEWTNGQDLKTPLIVAALYGNTRCVAFLLHIGANKNAVDKDKNSALHYAASLGHANVVKVLLEYDVNTIRWNYRGFSPIDLARNVFDINDNIAVLKCIQLLEQKMKVYEGWLKHCMDNTASMLSGVSALCSWNQRYCLVLNIGSTEFLELVFYKKQPTTFDATNTSYSILYHVEELDCSTKSSSKWRSKSNAQSFSFNGCIKNSFCSANLSEKQKIVVAARNNTEVKSWQNFLGVSAKEILKPKTVSVSEALSNLDRKNSSRVRSYSTDSSASEFSQDELTPEELMVENAMTLSRKLNQGIISQEEILSANSNRMKPILQQVNIVETGVEKANDADIIDVNADCVICMEASQNTACVPCGHVAACHACMQHLHSIGGNCPVCRAEVDQIVKLFKA